MMAHRPMIRIVRSLARSGGTLFGKCLGCMDGVKLISEIHPGNLAVTSPMMQAHQWLGLIEKKDIARWKVRAPSVLQFVSLCAMRAQSKGEALVLRDWSHLDYIGVPYVKPTGGFALGDALREAYDLRVVTTVRHPIDQYLSLMGLPIVGQRLDFDAYLRGCMQMAEFASEHGFFRYEDFTQDPDSVLGSICEELRVDFDAEYRQKWFDYTTITGDTQAGLGRGSMKKEIVAMPRKAADEALLARFRDNADYQRACALLGYEN